MYCIDVLPSEHVISFLISCVRFGACVAVRCPIFNGRQPGIVKGCIIQVKTNEVQCDYYEEREREGGRASK